MSTATPAPRAPTLARLPALNDLAERSAAVVAGSTADWTRVTWIESTGARIDRGPDGRSEPHLWHHRTVLLRVREGTRTGIYETHQDDPAELAQAVRQAVAVSRVAPPAPAVAPWVTGGGAGDDTRPLLGLWNAGLARLEPADADELLEDWLGDSAEGASPPKTPAGFDARFDARFEWCRTRLVVATSNGETRRVGTTAARLDIAGLAAAAGRSLDQLRPAQVMARAHARRRHREDSPAPASLAPDQPVLLVLSQEAVAGLLALLARYGLSSRSFEPSGPAPLAGLLGEHVFAPGVHLVDDGLAESGLPFPVDLAGRLKRRIALIDAGVPRTPAVDGHLAARLGLPVTPHACGLDEGYPLHLFLGEPPDGASPTTPPDDLAGVSDGVFISTLAALQCHDPARLGFCARAQGVRRIEGGRLAGQVPDLYWEDSLLRVFSRLRAVGDAPVTTCGPLEKSLGLGGTTAPVAVIEGAEVLRRG